MKYALLLLLSFALGVQGLKIQAEESTAVTTPVAEDENFLSQLEEVLSEGVNEKWMVNHPEITKIISKHGWHRYTTEETGARHKDDKLIQRTPSKDSDAFLSHFDTTLKEINEDLDEFARIDKTANCAPGRIWGKHQRKQHKRNCKWYARHERAAAMLASFGLSRKHWERLHACLSSARRAHKKKNRRHGTNDPYYMGDPYYMNDPTYAYDPYYTGDSYYMNDPYYMNNDDQYNYQFDQSLKQEPFLAESLTSYDNGQYYDSYYTNDPYYTNDSYNMNDPYYTSDPYYPTDSYYPMDTYYPMDPYYMGEPNYGSHHDADQKIARCGRRSGRHGRKSHMGYSAGPSTGGMMGPPGAGMDPYMGTGAGMGPSMGAGAHMPGGTGSGHMSPPLPMGPDAPYTPGGMGSNHMSPPLPMGPDAPYMPGGMGSNHMSPPLPGTPYTSGGMGSNAHYGGAGMGPPMGAGAYTPGGMGSGHMSPPLPGTPYTSGGMGSGAHYGGAGMGY